MNRITPEHIVEQLKNEMAGQRVAGKPFTISEYNHPLHRTQGKPEPGQGQEPVLRPAPL